MSQQLSAKNSFFFAGAALVVLVLAQMVGSFLVQRLPVGFGRDGYFAVFLAHGQVYFGTIPQEKQNVVFLHDVYYLKLSKPVLSQEDLQNASDASLVKLGNELHGPEDQMEINRAQILFIEKLKKDGKVAKAIEQYQSEQGR